MTTIVQCYFRRTKRSKMERGFAVAKYHGVSDVITIIPEHGKQPASIWNYDLIWDEGALTLNLPMPT